MAVETLDHEALPISGERPTGLAAAALLAGGVGVFVLGLMTTLAEASAGFADGLKFNDRVGPLSGKTIIAVAAFFGSWAVLSALLARRDPPLRPVLVSTAALVVLGLVMTFPTFFQAFE
jgi:hypothetical protein